MVERSGRTFTEITHVFRGAKCPAGVKCGDPFGVRQLVAIFTEDALRRFESRVVDMVAHDERWLSNTLGVSPPGATGDQKARTKYFFPKYTYGERKTLKRGDSVAAPHAPRESVLALPRVVRKSARNHDFLGAFGD